MKLFVYEHCPYCIRVRVALALKGVRCDVKYLLDDDIQGHLVKTGVKEVPILQKDDGSYMGESADIIDYIDGLDGNPMFADKTLNEDVKNCLESMQPSFSSLVFSYTYKLNLPELATASARHYYIERYLKHIPYETIDKIIIDRAELKHTVANTLYKLVPLLGSEKSITGDNMGIDEVYLFPRLYLLTAIEDIDIPPLLQKYIENVCSVANLKALNVW